MELLVAIIIGVLVTSGVYLCLRAVREYMKIDA